MNSTIRTRSSRLNRAGGMGRAFAYVGAIVFCLIISAINGVAADVYVAQTGLGQATGADAADAFPMTWLTTQSNWNNGAGTINPGDTVHLTGPISSQFLVLGSGSANAPITILFEPNARMSAPYWPGNFVAIGVVAQNWIVIDGGTNGVIECTAQGTGQNAFPCAGVYLAGACNNVIVRNLTIQNMYVRSSTTDLAGGGVGLGVGVGSNAGSNIVVTNCTIHDAYVGVEFQYSNVCSNFEMSNCEVYNCNWGGSCQDTGPASRMSGLKVHNNKLHDWSNWNDTVNNSFHHNGFYGWAESGGIMNDASFYNNLVGPNYGGGYSTSGVFFSGGIYLVNVYNNVFVANPGDQPADGMVTIGTYMDSETFMICNNTFVANGTGNALAYSGAHPGTALVENNIAIGCCFCLFNNSNITLTENYNLFYNLVSTEQFSISSNGTSNFQSFAQWQALGYDANSIVANPNLGSNYAPTTGSPAIGQGINLSAYFTTDFAGNVRPAKGNWDIGAFQTTGPAAPTGLRVIPPVSP